MDTPEPPSLCRIERPGAPELTPGSSGEWAGASDLSKAGLLSASRASPAGSTGEGLRDARRSPEAAAGTTGMVADALILGRYAGSEDLHGRSVLLDTIADALTAAAVAVTGGIVFLTHGLSWLNSDAIAAWSTDAVWQEVDALRGALSRPRRAHGAYAPTAPSWRASPTTWKRWSAASPPDANLRSAGDSEACGDRESSHRRSRLGFQRGLMPGQPRGCFQATKSAARPEMAHLIAFRGKPWAAGLLGRCPWRWTWVHGGHPVDERRPLITSRS
jgi:hypothetical protein